MDANPRTTTAQRLGRLTEASRALRRDLRGLGDERAMLERACRTAVEIGLFRFAWIGVLDRVARTLEPVVSWGTSEGYLAAVRITLDEVPFARGPSATALLEQRPCVCADIAQDPRMEPWRAAALARGFRSSGAFPLLRGGVPYGVVNVYASEVGFVDPLEQELLEGVVEDLGAALDALDRERARSEMEARLQTTEARHRTQFDLASDGMFLADAGHRFIDVNPAGCAMLGYTRDELLALRIEDIVAPDNLAGRPVKVDGDPGVSFLSERLLRRKDGTTLEVEIHGVRLPDGGMQSVARDVSERKRLHATRAASERMMSLGRLAQGVGHEINNPLAYLTLSLELARSKLGPEAAHPDLDSALANAQDGVARITHIVKALVAFGRGDTEVVKPTRLQAVVEGALTLTANRLRHVARVDVDLDASLFVVANEFQLGQVFVNLLLNAADAMEEAPADRHVVRITSRVTAGGRVLVEVADSGPGIPAPALERVFDPFFTTKAVGRGTGIGLSISKAILATFDGTLEAANGERGGAVFRVGLAASEVAPKTPPVAREVPVPRLRVLVVDDEVTVGRLIHRTLTEHDVTVVTSAPAALSLCLREAFDVLLCDLMLPEMSGEALRRELLARAPALEPRMVFMTGGAFTDSTTDFLASVEERVLLKPFTAHALRAALAAAVARAPG